MATIDSMNLVLTTEDIRQMRPAIVWNGDGKRYAIAPWSIAEEVYVQKELEKFAAFASDIETTAEYIEGCKTSRTPSCARYNPYPLPYQSDSMQQVRMRMKDTTAHLNGCVMHCAMGVKCPTYYSRNDVMQRGFIDSSRPLLARLLYTFVCPPHVLNCQCAKHSEQIPVEIQNDESCYCQVVYAELTTLMRLSKCLDQSEKKDYLFTFTLPELFDDRPKGSRDALCVLKNEEYDMLQNYPKIHMSVTKLGAPLQIFVWDETASDRVGRIIKMMDSMCPTTKSEKLQNKSAIETKEKPTRCCYVNRYPMDESYVKNMQYEGFILHCPNGAKCPNFYSVDQVEEFGFRAPIPPLARLIFHELCPPNHPENCSCATLSLMDRLDTGNFDCYCRVAYADLTHVTPTTSTTSTTSTTPTTLKEGNIVLHCEFTLPVANLRAVMSITSHISKDPEEVIQKEWPFVRHIEDSEHRTWALTERNSDRLQRLSGLLRWTQHYFVYPDNYEID